MKKILFACSLALLLCGCSSDPETPAGKPSKPVSPELQQKISELNQGVVALPALTEAIARSIVTGLTEEADGTRIVFQDETEMTLVCDKDRTEAPLVGIVPEGDVYYWALSSLPGRPWLKNAAGERMPLSGAVPVMGVDECGLWTVTTGTATAPWRIVDASGDFVEATGEESVAMFRSTEIADGRVVVTLTSGGTLSADMVYDLSPELQQKIETLNQGVVTLKTLAQAVSHSMATALVEEADGTRIIFRDGTEVTLVCDKDGTEAPLMSTVKDGEVSYWALTSLPGRPWLMDAAGERMPLSGPVPVTGVDERGFWTVIAEGAAAPWCIVDASGDFVKATGAESVAMFRSAGIADGRVVVTLTSGEKLTADMVNDLSAVATANCYVVSAPGVYIFRASVRGNGVGEVGTTGFAPQIELTDGMTADWLWTDNEGLVSKVSFDKTSGMIAFTLGEGRGNTLIALMQGGAVVWSWHIWAADAPRTMTYENGSVFMDRNLGAVGTTVGGADAYGLYYQWGRKDPFYSGEKTETSAEAFLQAKNNTVVNPTYADVEWMFSKSTATSAAAAAHPMTFYNNTVGVGYDWLAGPKATLWGAAKTLNDPCPAGYKVPEVDAWTNMSSGRNYIDGVSTWDNTNFGMTYTFNGQTAWYPAQGYRNYNSGSIVGLRGSTSGSGAYWSSGASAAKAGYLFFKKQLSSSSGSINPELDKERSYGYIVRCCKE